MPCGSQLNSDRLKMAVETGGGIKMADFYNCFVWNTGNVLVSGALGTQRAGLFFFVCFAANICVLFAGVTQCSRVPRDIVPLYRTYKPNCVYDISQHMHIQLHERRSANYLRE